MKFLIVMFIFAQLLPSILEKMVANKTVNLLFFFLVTIQAIAMLTVSFFFLAAIFSR